MTSVQLALGTVQFGMTYGIAGRGEPIPEREARAILATAWDCGIRVLDTAPAYGDIEERLDALTHGKSFRMVSKIPALTHATSADEVAALVSQSIQRTRARLGDRLSTVLFHRGDDLLGPHGEVAWRAAVEATAGAGLRLGVSCYSPAEAVAIRAKYPIAAVQIPGNALDQRLARAGDMTGIEVHLRSVFLQGLLLMLASAASARMPKAAAAMSAWEHWCSERRMPPLQAALSIAKALPAVRYCVVGVDRQSQLEEIAAAWERAEPLHAPRLAVDDLDVIDPRRW